MQTKADLIPRSAVPRPTQWAKFPHDGNAYFMVTSPEALEQLDATAAAQKTAVNRRRAVIRKWTKAIIPQKSYGAKVLTYQSRTEDLSLLEGWQVALTVKRPVSKKESPYVASQRRLDEIRRELRESLKESNLVTYLGVGVEWCYKVSDRVIATFSLKRRRQNPVSKELSGITSPSPREVLNSIWPDLAGAHAMSSGGLLGLSLHHTVIQNIYGKWFVTVPIPESTNKQPKEPQGLKRISLSAFWMTLEYEALVGFPTRKAAEKAARKSARRKKEQTKHG